MKNKIKVGKMAHLGVIVVVCPGHCDYPRSNEARKVVDMAISNGVIALHAPPQPYDLFQAQEVLQGLLDALPPQMRVSAGVQQALLRADQRPAPCRLLLAEEEFQKLSHGRSL